MINLDEVAQVFDSIDIEYQEQNLLLKQWQVQGN